MIRVDVTAGDCLMGAFVCPVTRAIARRVAGLEVEMIAADAVWISGRLAWLPADEAYRVQTFDRTGEMVPHSFHLELR